MTRGTVEYHSNNSGGSWWLTDADWYALQDAGWDVHWKKDMKSEYFSADKNGRWLGALATRATKSDTTMREAIDEWDSLTSGNPTALGCSCCGPPHSFSFDGDDGSHEYWSPSYPEYGDSYY